MTLDEAKKLLTENNISFETCEFENEAAYWHHVSMFLYTKNAKPCKVIALIIRSNNGEKNIELQFNAVDSNFHFEELRFGEFCFEMFEYNEEMLSQDLLNYIKDIKSGNCVVIIKNDLKNKKWLADARFDLNEEEDDVFGEPAFQQAMQCIMKPKGFIAKLLKTKTQYQIYDWNTYQCIEK